MDRLLSRAREEALLVVLLLAAVPLLLMSRGRMPWLPGLIDWRTIGALLGLMLLSRGLEESGYLSRAGAALLGIVKSRRALAVALVLFAAVLSAVVTNDVALFIVVPLTLGLRKVADLPIGRLVIFEALAVNAGSASSPVGNPQNLFLWNSSGVGFLDFTLVMLPLGAGLTLILLAIIPLAFSRSPISMVPAASTPRLDSRLFWLCLGFYPIFLGLTDRGLAPTAAAVVALVFFVAYRGVFLGIDWLLLLVFVLMFLDLGLLAALPEVARAAESALLLSGGVFSAGVLLSQVISNVPAAIFLESFTTDWQRLAWGVSVGGFGLAIGSLANLIALRLGREPGIVAEFHVWSIVMLVLGAVMAAGLLALGF